MSKFRKVVPISGLVAALASMGAHAQGSITLYGIADSALLFTNKSLDAQTGGNAGKRFALVDSGLSPSQFGLTGTEDLGAGLKAKFKLESGISMVNGGFNDSNGNLFGRQAWLALSGTFGELKAGLQFSPFFTAIHATDTRGYSNFVSGLVTYADNVFVTGAFNANAVSYTSPELAGFQGSAMLALGGQAGDFQAGRQYSASLQYHNGPLLVDAGFYDGNAGGTAQTPVPSTQAFVGRMIGISYSFGTVTASAAVVNYKVSNSFNDYVYSAGLRYQVAPQLALDSGIYVTVDRNDHANRSVMGAFGAQYFLSKRTTLYGQVGVVDNHGRMNTGLTVNGALFGVSGTTVGSNVGIRHLF
ncbi:Outer membrane protein (porin) [Paraburkholderia steynii]|uniref:Outer membrane protein (Porin) n=1 Tax=Paraburkholderia steynii TaxID=1245441 RepID=A0A7Z7FLG7_9BURK|nr:porin [Paraburkholderia steynii]SDI55877.1 Outer membrane protein (porin) [Paraburkholderia steynii]